jgi:hypothetical protein
MRETGLPRSPAAASYQGLRPDRSALHLDCYMKPRSWNRPHTMADVRSRTCFPLNCLYGRSWANLELNGVGPRYAFVTPENSLEDCLISPRPSPTRNHGRRKKKPVTAIANRYRLEPPGVGRGAAENRTSLTSMSGQTYFTRARHRLACRHVPTVPVRNFRTAMLKSR